MTVRFLSRWPSLAVAALLLAGTATAASYAVNTTVDATSPTLMANCAASSGTCTLRAAIMQANATTGADSISLPAGTYTLGIPGIDEDAAATGDLDITDDLAIYGSGAAQTIVDGGGLDRVLDILRRPTGELFVQIYSVTIRGGLTGGDGGGIRCDTGLFLDATTVTANEAQTGGGLSLGATGGVTASLHGAKITDNVASSSGAAVWTGGAGTVNLVGCTISRNSGSSIIANQIDSMLLEDSLVNDNDNTVSAAITSNNHLVLRRTSVTGNRLGGLRTITQAAVGLLELESSTVSGNGTWGITVATDGQLEVVGSTIGPHASGCINNTGGSVTLEGSIVACGEVTACTGIVPVSSGYNIDDDGTCGLVHPTDLPLTDAQLEPLTTGFRQVHPLAQASPAVDAWALGPWPARDGRYVERPQDGDADGVALADIGAYELVTDMVFRHGFEGGNCDGWSSAVGETTIP